MNCLAERRPSALDFLPLIRDPRDLIAYAILRVVKSRNLMSLGLLRRTIKSCFPQVVIRPAPLPGLRLALSTRDSSQVTILHEILVQGVYDLTCVPFYPDHVIDCGAHVGLFSLLAFQRFPKSRFTLFEPSPNNFALLQRTLALNGLNFTVIAAAVSDYEGSARLSAGPSYAHRLLTENEATTDSVSVRCVDLGQYISSSVSGNLLLKMDIEGHERTVLPAVAGRLPRRTAIFFETHAGEHGWKEAEACLTREGFAVQRTRFREPYADGFALRA